MKKAFRSAGWFVCVGGSAFMVGWFATHDRYIAVYASLSALLMSIYAEVSE